MYNVARRPPWARCQEGTSELSRVALERASTVRQPSPEGSEGVLTVNVDPLRGSMVQEQAQRRR